MFNRRIILDLARPSAPIGILAVDQFDSVRMLVSLTGGRDAIDDCAEMKVLVSSEGAPAASVYRGVYDMADRSFEVAIPGSQFALAPHTYDFEIVLSFYGRVYRGGRGKIRTRPVVARTEIPQPPDAEAVRVAVTSVNGVVPSEDGNVSVGLPPAVAEAVDDLPDIVKLDPRTTSAADTTLAVLALQDSFNRLLAALKCRVVIVAVAAISLTASAARFGTLRLGDEVVTPDEMEATIGDIRIPSRLSEFENDLAVVVEESDPSVAITNGTIYIHGKTLTPLVEHQRLDDFATVDILRMAADAATNYTDVATNAAVGTMDAAVQEMDRVCSNRTMNLLLSVRSAVDPLLLERIYPGFGITNAAQITSAESFRWSFKSDGTAELAGCSSAPGHIVVPFEVESDGTVYRVTSIGSRAFYLRQEMLSVTFPVTVVSIGEYAFYGCASLVSASLPSTLRSIGKWAFCSCSSLSETELPAELETLGEYAFYFCQSLTSMTIPPSLAEIGRCAFNMSSSLTNINVYAHDTRGLGGVVAAFGGNVPNRIRFTTIYDSDKVDNAAITAGFSAESVWPTFNIPLGGCWTDFELKATTNNFDGVSEQLVYLFISTVAESNDREWAYDLDCGFDENASVWYNDCGTGDPRALKRFEFLRFASIHADIGEAYSEGTYVASARFAPSFDGITVHDCYGRRARVPEAEVRAWMRKNNPHLRWCYVRIDENGEYERTPNGREIWRDIEPVWTSERKNFTP